ncbi:MAG: transglycosylase SLT domain-containing protein [Deltaproteobacteria bacterium]|jgi:hypothetical protein|nr:transglycosylase SLT domain-containing protein [Deltaproteobacteria bacterium]
MRPLPVCLLLALGLILSWSPLLPAAPELSFAGQNVPLTQPEVGENLDQELLLLAEAKSRIWLTIRRLGRFQPIVDTALSQAGVSGDFRYLPLVLTGLSPRYASQGRAGLWRLSANEAKAMGLLITLEIDERFDPAASSAAAAARLKSLSGTYPSPLTALAAFLDEGAVQAALAAAGQEKNFFRIYWPEPLEKTIYQILAGKVIFSSLETYGYQRTHTWPVLAKQRQKQESAGNLKELAAKHKVDYLTFRDMNPHILSEKVPAGASLYLP